MNTSIQLYSVRDCAEKDFFATLAEVARIGFTHVELAGYHGVSAAELRAELDRLGLRVSGSHESFDRLCRETEATIRDNATLGNRHLILPYYELHGAADAAALAAELRRILPQIKAAGMQLLYHNHDHEFRADEAGDLPIDLLLAQFSADELKLELDTYWSAHAGTDTPAYLHRNAARIPFVHLKDGSADGKPCALGEGIADLAAVVETVRALDHDLIVFENDDPIPDGISDAARSMKKLQSLLK